MTGICGIDFDNTIVSYDGVLSKIARERGLLRADGIHSKKEIRDKIRQLPGGEMEWRKCQAQFYGPRMSEAKLAEGVAQFFQLSRQHHLRLYIISHKKEFSDYDPSVTNLRKTAKEWMSANGFFDPDGFGLTPDDVYFDDTRRGKIDRIRTLGCTHFIDDLEEVFLEESFPSNVVRILYEPGRSSKVPADITLMTSWQDICGYFFGKH